MTRNSFLQQIILSTFNETYCKDGCYAFLYTLLFEFSLCMQRIWYSFNIYIYIYISISIFLHFLLYSCMTELRVLISYTVVSERKMLQYSYITKTCLYNTDPFKPHFYIVKLGFTGVYIIFLISAQNIDCGYLLEPHHRGGSNGYPQSMF